MLFSSNVTGILLFKSLSNNATVERKGNIYYKSVPTTTLQESNTLVNSNFSSTYSFIDTSSDNLLETFYSNVNIETPIATPASSDTRQNKTLDQDYERLMKDRNQEFKSIERH